MKRQPRSNGRISQKRSLTSTEVREVTCGDVGFLARVPICVDFLCARGLCQVSTGFPEGEEYYSSEHRESTRLK